VLDLNESSVETVSSAGFPAYQQSLFPKPNLFMKDLYKLILPIGFVATIGACAPYPPHPNQPQGPQAQQAPPKTPEQTAADEKQRQIDESRRRLEREEARRRQKEREANNPTPPAPTKPSYPTATSVPGKEGFVFNPYTQNIVDVKGIASGKLVRDPEDSNPDHKFRVP